MIFRSARLHTARDIWAYELHISPPGNINEVKGSKSDSILSMKFSIFSISSKLIVSKLFLLDFDANKAPILNKQS